MAQGNKSIDMLKPISIEDLLSRPSVKPQYEFLTHQYILNILITGAIGSIGSEILKVVKQSASLIMIDNSESLYLIDCEIKSM